MQPPLPLQKLSRDCLQMQKQHEHWGIPSSSPANSALSTCADFDIRSGAVELLKMPGPSGELMSTGQANVRFASPAVAEAACQEKNGKTLGPNLVECLPLAPQMQPPFAGRLPFFLVPD